MFSLALFGIQDSLRFPLHVNRFLLLFRPASFEPLLEAFFSFFLHAMQHLWPHRTEHSVPLCV